MGRIKNPFTGKINGKLENLVFYEYRGRACVRSKPQFQKTPSSPGQVAQQERIAAVALFYQALKEVGIYAHWQKAAEGQLLTGYNLLVKANLNAFDGEGNICDFSKINLTPGGLPLPDNLLLKSRKNGEWVAEWDTDRPLPKAKGDDRLMIALMKNAETYDVKLPDIGDYRREEGIAVFRIPQELKDFVYLFVYFCSRTGEYCTQSRLITNSTYYG